MMMKTMRFILSSSLIAVGLTGLVSCGDKSDREEENASVVNIEKGVTSPMWTSDGDGSVLPEADIPSNEATALPEQPEIEEAQETPRETPQEATQSNPASEVSSEE